MLTAMISISSQNAGNGSGNGYGDEYSGGAAVVAESHPRDAPPGVYGVMSLRRSFELLEKLRPPNRPG